MTRRLTLAFALLAGALAWLAPSPAKAHPYEAYIAQWTTTAQTYQFRNNFPTGAPRDRANEAAATWNAVPNSLFRWSLGATSGADYTPPGPCPNVLTPRNGVHWTYLDGDPSGVDTLGSTWICRIVNSTTNLERATNMELALDSGNPGWYWGTGTPGSGQIDAKSVLTHEFGHAGGHLVHWDEYPYDFEVNCSTTSAQETMCMYHYLGTTHQRSLGTHDSHTFANAY